MSHDIDTITPAIFDSILLEYPNTVPDKLTKLDQERYNTIPGSVKEKDSPSLSKAHVITLVDWKL